MNRDDVIRMAREAFGIELIVESDKPKLEHFAKLVAAHEREAGSLVSTPYDVWRDRFAALVAAAEREACVEVCDNLIRHGNVAEVQHRYNQAYEQCKDAIRARDAQPSRG
jgi:hypothetical protein